MRAVVIGLLLGRRRKRGGGGPERRPRQLYAPLLEGRRIDVGGRTFIARSYTVAGDYLIIETVDGRIVRVPLSGRAGEGEGEEGG